MLVEGIADDLLMGTLVFVFGLAVVLMILIKRQHYVQRIHPESQDNVNFTRQLITQQPNSSESRIRSEEITCPICLGDAIYAVETNCSHIFCGNCILAYWHHGSWIGAMRCPVCRQQVIDYIRDLPTLLRHAFTEFFTWNGLLLVFRVRIIICFVAVLLYFVTPFDIIPEAAFGIFGFLDDFFILFMLAIYISIIYRQAVEERAHY
ncbi:E3 ubiquitin-protein ligase RNF170-like isoform X2 [Tubulanus polymorphus]|uniref:E3 ubiquitin-protein ligase RNF170-like isoform X2 n=1 Tax=Tubulanus polymorphus TaxID=672921 RepID=UPI003DA2EB60